MVAVKSAVVKEAAVKAALATLATTNHADVHTHAPAEPTHFISTGGCGNKILRLLTGQADVALLNLACSMWDTCATAALLCALGGAVCTLAGYPIEHVHAPASGTYGNMHGVVAVGSGFDQRLSGLLRCTRAVWLERLRALPAVLALYRESMGEGYCEGLQSQALDLARDIDGCPFTVERLREITKDHNITGFTANECETVRYKQSHACRIRFIGGDIKSVFYKRTVLRELPYAVMKSRTVPFKITRDVQSCGVESSFLANPLVHTLEASASFSMAIPYLVQKRVFWDTPLDARFTSVLPDLSMEGGNWSQSAYLDTAQLKAALKALAEFHNFFWLNNSTPRRTGDHDSDPERNNHGATRPTQTSKHELAAQLWTTGSYWHLGRQPKGQLDKIITNWQRLYTDVFEFDKHCEDDRLSEGVAARDMETLGARLSQLAERASVATHNIDATGAEIESDADAREPYSAQTIIHGDPKAPNFFFRSRQESAKPITEANDRECGGVREGSQAGAKVHASACVGSSHSEKSAGVSDDKETSGCESDTELEVGLIDFQWAGKGLVATDVAYCIAASAHKSCFEESSLETFLAFYYACLDRDSLSYDTFRTQFDLAFIDLGRIVVADHWGAITMATLRKREGKFVFNAYNKSEAIAIWFLRELSRCLDRQLACMDS
ncbi:hypothetical protein SARC_08493 [Sphaeroforma arctica JP610]|uniref:3'(2'),5'-bisphosphate nucleotidase n=1 Tax=Sphaeroforma arctica JP610 TaxID=667725 RepID=A0A0L0FRD6_9EUKA|nr:hypothetical protein SARC_08493 [Sphaeroforma arctica JP610]KNC79096.1 hypothetical protein SARC_08493 [Sphaeroforma arctica JP610]|eukprot:XP_014152998.1 hypothetical protein SARC_08493 [Sphaeroforma arctica JP610]